MDCSVECGKIDIQSGLSEIYTRLYTTLLKSFIYDDVAFEKNAIELTLGTILNDHPPNFPCDGGENVSVAERADSESADSIFREDEILVYGMPERRQLSPAATKRLRDEINATLQTFAELFHANSSTRDLGGSCPPPISSLPDDLQRQVSDIDSMQLELDALSLRLTELVGKTKMAREEFDRELEHLICTTFPAFKASRNASIDLLSATFEATLQRLNSIRESARQAFYNHQVGGDTRNTKTVSRAISIAYQTLVEEEGALRAETQDLDRQIQEYESLLRLVDGSSGGYQQIVSDWVKTKRETDECLKDLRRLGWTGD